MLQNVTDIIIHGGRAHKDEVLALMVALGSMSQTPKVYRKDPSEEELNNPNILIMDVGKQYNPQLLNFDNHQTDGNRDTCGVKMIVDHLGLTGGFELFPWWETVILMDCKGPKAVADSFNINQQDLFKLMSPIEGIFINLFQLEGADGKEVSKGLINLLKIYGVNLINNSKILKNSLDSLNSFTTTRIIKNVETIIFDTSEQLGFDLWRDKHHPNAMISISRNKDRNTQKEDGGWVLYRYEDFPKVDFKKLEGNENIIFAHNNGFLAITKPMNIERAVELASGCISD